MNHLMITLSATALLEAVAGFTQDFGVKVIVEIVDPDLP